MTDGTTESGGILAKTARGAGWLIAWRMVSKLLGFLSVFVLVRLLTPQDFGLIALAYTFIAALEACTEIGVDAQLLRAEDPDRALYDTAFTMNLLRGVAFSLLLGIAAGPIARFYGDPALEPVILALAAIFLLGSASNVAIIDFRRTLNFGRQFKLLLLPRLLQAISGVAAAYALRSHWALVFAVLVQRTSAVLMSYTMHPFRPRLSLTRWRSLVSVSFWAWVYGTLSMLRDRADSMIIGRVLGPTSVGLYTVSMELAHLPASELVGPISHATNAGYAADLRASGNDAAGQSFHRVLGLAILVSLPMGFGISLLSSPIVIVALGEAWRDASQLIAIFSVAFIFYSLGQIALALLVAHLKLRTMSGIILVPALLRIMAVIMLLPTFGLTGAVVGVSIAVMLEHGLYLFNALRIARLRMASLWWLTWRPALACAAMVLVLWQAGLGWLPPAFTTSAAIVTIIAGTSLGSILYAICLIMLWFAAGRPQGPEADLLMVLTRLAGSMRERLRVRFGR